MLANAERQQRILAKEWVHICMGAVDTMHEAPCRRLRSRLSNLQERMDGIESKRRNRPAEESLPVWKEMVAGSAEGKRYCMRFKINMQVPPTARTCTALTTALTCAFLSASKASVALV